MRPLRLAVRTLPFQGRDQGFESPRGRQFTELRKSGSKKSARARNSRSFSDGKLNFNFIFCPPKRKFSAYALVNRGTVYRTDFNSLWPPVRPAQRCCAWPALPAARSSRIALNSVLALLGKAGIKSRGGKVCRTLQCGTSYTLASPRTSLTGRSYQYRRSSLNCGTTPKRTASPSPASSLKAKPPRSRAARYSMTWWRSLSRARPTA